MVSNSSRQTVEVLFPNGERRQVAFTYDRVLGVEELASIFEQGPDLAKHSRLFISAVGMLMDGFDVHKSAKYRHKVLVEIDEARVPLLGALKKLRT